jgi:phosphoglycolate phosphatase-like HAD superfamily hydrolase
MNKAISLLDYATWVFDCDGVLLNSNLVKSEAFYKVALPYGEHAAAKLLDFHIQHGGISRFEKFRYLFSEILHETDYEVRLKSALESFATSCTDALTRCETSPGLMQFLEKIRDGRRKTFIVSGGAQDELQLIFKKRSLDKYFDGIFGSPDNKVEILTREILNQNILLPAIFLGDSRYDYEAANSCGLDFIFVSGWTEFDEWKKFFEHKKILVVTQIDDLL